MKNIQYWFGMNYRSAALFALSISLIFHLFFAIMFIYGRDAVMPPDAVIDKPVRVFSFYRIITSAAFTFIFSLTIFLLNFKLLKLEKPRKFNHKLLLIITCTLIATLTLSWILTTIQLNLFDHGPHPERALKGGFTRDFFISIIIVFSLQLRYANDRQQQIAVENEILKTENEKTKYEVLKNQVNPHFLFNSFNTLNSIIKTDPDKAQQYVQELSYIFRYTLQSKDVISLGEELKFTQAYCSLMQIRYGESLYFNYDLDFGSVEGKEYMNYLIIPLSIQTLIENAIKHNIISNKQPLTVTIRTSDNGNSIIVSNPIQLRKTSEEGEGIGLANLSERYQLKWQKEITISNSNDIFSVEIPLIKS
jgi:sensor histidine kinase YesM